MAHQAPKTLTYNETVACQSALFEWAESFDTKDWERLSQCIAPTLYVDYRAVMGMIWESMPAAEFIGLVSSDKFLGNDCIKTQHFIGASKWVRMEDGDIHGYHQMRVAHHKYTDASLSEVKYKGHAHGKATTRYHLVDGVWKFAGLAPEVRWGEHDLDKIFEHE
ncbi:hypothetical protein LTR56_005091 [Elasticomyces elasticus]|nr:hypothetical protein LTR22_021982 [Elasticomyces elasticus]KAK3652381.1 hypothetical protein LTR56_005091 [Elasticomyces elasticus]KAK4921249.1 hypothetical protein LTR49_011252 [Elasticomyces elasticus]KAK5748108.1 hypothetical protein LTS12_021843 [Elasticomyces elasticus]